MNTTILLIEDNPEMSENIVSILELANYNVLAAPNGKIGVELAQKKLPDLILCDVMMPELDGFEVAARMHGSEEWRDVPIVVVTAKDLTPEDRRRLSGATPRWQRQPKRSLGRMKRLCSGNRSRSPRATTPLSTFRTPCS